MVLPSVRQSALLLHRYVGLVMAGFLVLAGITGSLLVWNDALEVWLAPRLFEVAMPAEGTQAIDGLQLRNIILERYADAEITHVPLRVTPGRSVMFNLRGCGAQQVDQVMVNPYTGDILGTRKAGRLEWAGKSVMPFVYRLHQSLALGVVGTYTFGVMALLWTMDCLVGLFLTFPSGAKKPAKKSWAARWWPAWKIRPGVRGYKLHFDMHRAGALWCWALLLVIAWSSVAFNLSEIYDPVMGRLFTTQSDEALLSRRAESRPPPALNWEQGRARGRTLMAELATQHGFIILREDMLAFDAQRAIYRYDVRSSLDLRQRAGSTQVYFDADSGEQLAIWLPTGAAAGDTIRTWITSIHMAAIWGWPLKLMISLAGIVVAMLSVTGVLLWWRRYRSRRETASQRADVPAGTLVQARKRGRSRE